MMTWLTDDSGEAEVVSLVQGRNKDSRGKVESQGGQVSATTPGSSTGLRSVL